MFDGESYAKAYGDDIKLSENITILPTDNCALKVWKILIQNHNFVDIDYIVNLVNDLDFEGLLYLRNVVEELIKK